MPPVIVTTLYLPSSFGQEIAKESFGLQVKLTPVRLSITAKTVEASHCPF